MSRRPDARTDGGRWRSRPCNRERRSHADGPCSGCSTASGWGWASLKAAFWFILIDLHARLHPRPGLLLHGQPDDRPRHPRLEPGQLLPARRTRPCRARRRSAPSCRGRHRRPRSPCRRRGPTAPSSSPARRSSSSAGPTGRRPPTRRSCRRSPGPATSTSGPRGRSSRRRARMPRRSYSGGKIYVVGGVDASGKPTDTVYILAPDATTGALGSWQTSDDAKLDLKLPESRCPAPWSWPAPTGCSSSAAPTARGPSTRSTSRRSTRPARRRSGPRSPPSCSRRSPTPRPRSSASYVWVYGGTMADGTPTGTVQRGEFGSRRQGDDARPVRRPRVRLDQPAGAADEHRRVRRQRRPLRGRRQ